MLENPIEDLKVMYVFYIFIGCAVTFSLLNSFLGIPLTLMHSIIPAGIFFIGNGIKLIYDEYY